jgi:DNA mismatch repair protein MSH5
MTYSLEWCEITVSPFSLFHSSTYMNLRNKAEENGSVFRVRLAKDFVAAKGRERLLSLKLFSALPVDDFETTTENDVDAPSNAHGFMKQQRQSKGLDPAYSRWQTIIRLGSYTAVDTLPICVSLEILFASLF